MKFRRYTEYEDNVIRRGIAAGRPLDDIADLIDRTRRSVVDRASRCLGLIERATCRHFSEQEDAVIRRGYAVDRPINEIAAELGRSRSAIARRASAHLRISDKSRGGRMAAALVGPEGCRRRGLAGIAAHKRLGNEIQGAAPHGIRAAPRWHRKARAMREAGEKIEYIAEIVRRSKMRVSEVCRGIVVARAHQPDSVSVANSVSQATDFPSREMRPSLPLDRRPTA